MPGVNIVGNCSGVFEDPETEQCICQQLKLSQYMTSVEMSATFDWSYFVDAANQAYVNMSYVRMLTSSTGDIVGVQDKFNQGQCDSCCTFYPTAFDARNDEPASWLSRSCANASESSTLGGLTPIEVGFFNLGFRIYEVSHGPKCSDEPQVIIELRMRAQQSSPQPSCYVSGSGALGTSSAQWPDPWLGVVATTTIPVMSLRGSSLNLSDSFSNSDLAASYDVNISIL